MSLPSVVYLGLPLPGFVLAYYLSQIYMDDSSYDFAVDQFEQGSYVRCGYYLDTFAVDTTTALFGRPLDLKFWYLAVGWHVLARYRENKITTRFLNMRSC